VTAPLSPQTDALRVMEAEIERILTAPIEQLEAEERLRAAPRHWIKDRCKWCLAETVIDARTRSCERCLGLPANASEED
jgi:hypothetical protein